MNEKIVALKLILDELNVGQNISTVDQRMETQKAVYLAQIKGIDLGYSYGWYLKGPYSPKLTRDYYSLHSGTDEEVVGGRSLKGRVRQTLQELRQLVQNPIEGLSRPRWLELLASVHYLIRESGYTPDKAQQRLAETKPHLARHFQQGFEALRQNALI